MTTSYASKVPPIAARYFGSDVHPTIFEVFIPGSGWKRQGGRKRVSYSALRKLRVAGATRVALSVHTMVGRCRVADFSIAELVNSHQ